jgi:hypothetical protein
MVRARRRVTAAPCVGNARESHSTDHGRVSLAPSGRIAARNWPDTSYVQNPQRRTRMMLSASRREMAYPSCGSPPSASDDSPSARAPFVRAYGARPATSCAHPPRHPTWTKLARQPSPPEIPRKRRATCAVCRAQVPFTQSCPSHSAPPWLSLFRPAAGAHCRPTPDEWAMRLGATRSRMHAPTRAPARSKDLRRRGATRSPTKRCPSSPSIARGTGIATSSSARATRVCGAPPSSCATPATARSFSRHRTAPAAT